MFETLGEKAEEKAMVQFLERFTDYPFLVKFKNSEYPIGEGEPTFTVNFKDKKGTKKYSSYVERALKRLGYKTYHQIVDMSEYSVPQKRKRFILVAMKNHSPKDVFSLLENNRRKFCNTHGITNKTTVYEAISDLEKGCGTCPSPDTKGFKAGIYGVAQSGYQKLMRQGMGGLNEPVDSHRFVNHRKDTISLHEDLLKYAPIGKRITPNDNIVEGLNRRGVTVLDKNSQAPTITSIPDELVHYCEPRILTVREHARIQSLHLQHLEMMQVCMVEPVQL